MHGAADARVTSGALYFLGPRRVFGGLGLAFQGLEFKQPRNGSSATPYTYPEACHAQKKKILTQIKFRESRTVIWPDKFAEKFPISSHRFSRDKVGTHRSLVRRASAARAILLANAASLYSSQQAAQAVPSQFVAKSGERDGSGASSRTPTLLIFDEKFAISSPSPNSPSKTRDCTGKSNGRLRVQKFGEKIVKFPPNWPNIYK